MPCAMCHPCNLTQRILRQKKAEAISTIYLFVEENCYLQIIWYGNSYSNIVVEENSYSIEKITIHLLNL